MGQCRISSACHLDNTSRCVYTCPPRYLRSNIVFFILSLFYFFFFTPSLSLSLSRLQSAYHIGICVSRRACGRQPVAKTCRWLPNSLFDSFRLSFLPSHCPFSCCRGLVLAPFLSFPFVSVTIFTVFTETDHSYSCLSPLPFLAFLFFFPCFDFHYFPFFAFCFCSVHSACCISLEYVYLPAHLGYVYLMSTTGCLRDQSIAIPGIR